MNGILDYLRTRRSIRSFSDKPVSEDQINLLKEALLRAPTSRGLNPWQFIQIDDPTLLKAIAQSKMSGSAFLAKAPLAFAICADETVSDVWLEDCSIAAITLHYMAHSIGLGSCWVQIRQRQHSETVSSEDYLKKLLVLPAHLRVVAVIGVGHPAETKEGHPASALPDGRFHRNDYGQERG